MDTDNHSSAATARPPSPPSPPRTLRILATVGSTRFDALVDALLQPTTLDAIARVAAASQEGTTATSSSSSSTSAAAPPAAEPVATLLIQHGRQPLADILTSPASPFVTTNLDPGSEYVPAPGLHRTGKRGLGGWTWRASVIRSTMDPGRTGTLGVGLDQLGLIDEKPHRQHGAQESSAGVVRRRRGGRRQRYEAGSPSDRDDGNAAGNEHDGSAQSSESAESDAESRASFDLGRIFVPDEEGTADGDGGAAPSTGPSSSTRTARIRVTTRQGVRVELVDFLPDMAGAFAQVDAVISHAGSGTVLECLRTEPARAGRTAPPRLLVVPNTTLMHNHQQELADALADAGHVLSGKPSTLAEDVTKLLASLGADRQPAPASPPKPRPAPSPPSSSPHAPAERGPGAMAARSDASDGGQGGVEGRAGAGWSPVAFPRFEPSRFLGLVEELMAEEE